MTVPNKANERVVVALQNILIEMQSYTLKNVDETEANIGAIRLLLSALGWLMEERDELTKYLIFRIIETYQEVPKWYENR